MYRYEAVRTFINVVFRRFNVELLQGVSCCGLAVPLLVSNDRLGSSQFFLPPGILGAEKNEAVGIAVARLLLEQHGWVPCQEADRVTEESERYDLAARLLIPQHAVKKAIREGWTPKQLADEALVSEEMADHRLRTQYLVHALSPPRSGMIRSPHRTQFERQQARYSG